MLSNYTYQISDNASVTYAGDTVSIRATFRNNGLSKSFYVNIFLIATIIFVSLYNKLFQMGLIVIIPIFFISIFLFAMKSDLKYLFKYKWLKEELKIDLERIYYFRNNKRAIQRKFDSCYLAFNIENLKADRPDYDENKNLFNPTMCLIGSNEKIFLMHALTLNDAISVFDELEKWYLKNNVIDNLKIFRRSSNEITIYKNRYWKDEFSKNLFGGIH